MNDKTKDARNAGKPAASEGHCDPRFARVRDAFEAILAGGEDVGSSVSVTLNGATVVDLWGGYADAARTQPWERDTIVNMMSVAKGASAVCAHILVDRGLLDLDTPVAAYWPEFAQAGKKDLPVRFVLDHRAGLPVIKAPLPPGAIYDWNAMTSALAAQAPLWEPGAKAGYHILTQGYIIGELVRRISGRTLGTYFRDEVAEPLGLDYHIGLPAEHHARCAEFIAARKGTILDQDALDPDSLLARAWAQVPLDIDFNSNSWRESEIPSGNGHGNARAVARLYGALACGGELDGVTLMRRDSLERAIAEQHSLTEIVLGRTYHQALGFVRNSPPIVPMGPNPRAFGHHGVGGSVGFADPDARIGFAYATNTMHARLDIGPRAGSLIEATFDSL